MTDGVLYYRCCYDGTVVLGDDVGHDCPVCERALVEKYHGELAARTQRVVTLPLGDDTMTVILPDAHDSDAPPCSKG